jgi:hypothetical protein
MPLDGPSAIGKATAVLGSARETPAMPRCFGRAIRATPTANPAEGLFYLALQDVGFADVHAWTLHFDLNTTGAIVRIKNPGPDTIELIGQGGSSDDCFKGTESTVQLASQASTTAADITKLYGSPANYPRDLAACAVIAPGNSPPLRLGFSSRTRGDW